MSRHRDIRNMDYSEDYDGYDDIYGHSVDDDYCISPSNRQFIYNRDRLDSVKFSESDIQEVEEADELSDVDKVKLESCIDQIKLTIGDSVIVPKNELVNLILKYKFEAETVINTILEDRKYQIKGMDKKDVTKPVKKFVVPSIFNKNIQAEANNSGSAQKFNIPNIFNQKTSPEAKKFFVPNIFGSQSEQQNLVSTTKKFIVPNIFGPKKNCSTSQKTNFDLTNFNQSGVNSIEPNEVQNVSSMLSYMDITHKTHKVNVSDSFHIDLTNALTTSISVPNIKVQKTESEKFEMPFIDCEVILKETKERNKFVVKNASNLDCTLDMKNIAYVKLKYAKTKSKFAKVICRKYKSLNKISIAPCDSKYIENLRRFRFDTASPDDFVLSHLKK